jgi:tetratricopeptide (TPR) repeat protein
MSTSVPVWINDGQHNLDIARFVIEGDPVINQLVAQASDELRIRTDYGYWGFASAVADGSPEVLTAAVGAIYLHLMADHQLFYEFELAYHEATGEQQIQLPAVTAQVKKGTCIDLVLFFLSALAQAKLRPVYIQLNSLDGGHALAGAWIAPPTLAKEEMTLNQVQEHLQHKQLLALECTGLVKGYPGRQDKMNFREAQEEAWNLIHDVSWAGWAVDVCQAWENQSVVPLTPVTPLPQRRLIDLNRIPAPADPKNFFGRDHLLTALAQAWQHQSSHIIQLVASGGFGKSTIVWHWLQRLREEQFPNVRQAFGWTFYRPDLHEGTPTSLPFFTAIHAHFSQLGLPFHEEELEEDSLRGRGLARRLTETGGLLILDGVEPLQFPPTVHGGMVSDRALAEFITSLSEQACRPGPHPWLVVITTRWGLPELREVPGVQTLDIAALDLPASTQVLRHFRFRHKGQDRSLYVGVSESPYHDPAREQEVFEQAASSVGCHPLALILLGSYVARYLDGDLSRWKEAQALGSEWLGRSDPAERHARRIMRGHLEMLGKEQDQESQTCLRVLRLLALCDRPLEPEVSEHLRTGLPDPIPGITDGLESMHTFTRAVDELRDWRILSGGESAGALEAHPLIRESIAEALRTSEEGKRSWQQAHSHLYDYFRARDDLLTGEQQLDRYERAIMHAGEAGLHDHAFEHTYQGLVTPLNPTHSQDIAILRRFYAGRWASPSSLLGKEHHLPLITATAKNLRVLGRFPEALESYRLLLRLHQKAGNPAGEVNVHDNLSRAYIYLGKLPEGLQSARASLKLLLQLSEREEPQISTSTRKLLISSYSMVGSAFSLVGELEQAQPYFDSYLEHEAELISSAEDETTRDNYLTFRLFQYVDFCVAAGLLEQARAKTEQAIAACERLEARCSRSTEPIIDMLFNKLLMARTLIKANDELSRAKRYVDEVVDGLWKRARYESVPMALLARAEWFRLRHELPSRREDLLMAKKLCERFHIHRYLTDVKLGLAWYHWDAHDRTQAEMYLRETQKSMQQQRYLRIAPAVAELVDTMSLTRNRRSNHRDTENTEKTKEEKRDHG